VSMRELQRIWPGEQISSEAFNRLVDEVERLNRLSVWPPLNLVDDATGLHITLDDSVGGAGVSDHFPARITQNLGNGAYLFVEQYPPNTDVPNGIAATATEYNFNGTLGHGLVVEIFEFIVAGVTTYWFSYCCAGGSSSDSSSSSSSSSSLSSASSSSGSPPFEPGSNNCLGYNVPNTLYMTLHNLSGCPNCDGVVIPILYVANEFSWDSGIIECCGHNVGIDFPQINLKCACPDHSPPFNEPCLQSVASGVFITGADNVSFNPFSASWTGVPLHTGLVNVTITE
jgi:hypothetical protein